MPVIEALARSENVSHVDLLTGAEYADDLRRSPWVRHVFAYDARIGRMHRHDGRSRHVEHDSEIGEYDVVVDLHTRAVPLGEELEALIAGLRGHRRVGYASPFSPSPADYTLAARGRDEHAVEYYARSVADLIDVPLGNGSMRITEAERAQAAMRLPPDPVCMAPGARYPWKRWPAESYAKLAGLLAAEGYSPLLIGQRPFDEPYVRAVRRLRDIPAIMDSTVELANLMAAAGLVIANNSGLTALAAASGAQVVCVHSHTLPAMWRPWGDGHANLTGEPGPCGCVGPAPHDLATPCGKGISPEDVFGAVIRLSRGRS